MHAAHRIDWEQGIVAVRVDGKLDPSELMALEHQVYADPAVRGFVVFVDLSGVKEVVGRAEDFRLMADEEKSLGPEAQKRRLVLWAPTDVGYGVARMFEVLAEMAGAWSQVEAFRSMEQARTALDVPADWEVGL